MELVDLYSQQDIREAVDRVGAQIAADFDDKNPLLVGVMTGSFIFLADLVRSMAIPCQIDFIRARSYGNSMESSGAVEITKDIEHDVAGRHVIVVEDILDTGLTIANLIELLETRNPRSIRVAALQIGRASCRERV